MEKADLDQIKMLGSLLYSPEQVAQVMGLNGAEFRAATESEEDPAGLAYWQGWYETDIPVRQSILTLAKRGSSPAQAQFLQMVQAAETRSYYGQ